MNLRDKTRLIQSKVGAVQDGIYGDGTADKIIAALGMTETVTPAFAITARGAAEIVGHEAIVPEWYLDSVKVGTWGVGVTNASGHNVDRYKDNPQPISKCLEVYVWLLREKYAPAVRAAFVGRELTEAQFHAALSFHYNTGAISKASWVKFFLAGEIAKAKTSFMEWRKPPEIVKRRQAECDLFFAEKWSGDGKATVLGVRKPSYTPDWKSAKRVDVLTPLKGLLG